MPVWWEQNRKTANMEQQQVFALYADPMQGPQRSRYGALVLQRLAKCVSQSWKARGGILVCAPLECKLPKWYLSGMDVFWMCSRQFQVEDSNDFSYRFRRGQ